MSSPLRAQIGLAAAEELAEDFVEVHLDRVERLWTGRLRRLMRAITSRRLRAPIQDPPTALSEL